MARNQNENALVARIERKFAGANSPPLFVGLGDDAALWSPRAGYQLILTCDWFLEGSHFLREKHPARAVGWKCLARATSDIAAMGGRPCCFLLSLALPGNLAGKWFDEFLGGLHRASRALGCELAGGDTTRHDRVLINITVIGEVRKSSAVLRSGAQPDDLIFVSGVLGEADLGLRQLRARPGVARPLNAALRKHLYPQPRLALGQWLVEHHLATAMMDLSDGLSMDLPRLCIASRVGARIDANSLPLTSGTTRGEALQLALHGGDDYELLFTVSARKAAKLPKKFQALALTKIGKITREKKILVETDGKAETLRAGGWDPFRRA